MKINLKGNTNQNVIKKVIATKKIYNAIILEFFLRKADYLSNL